MARRDPRRIRLACLAVLAAPAIAAGLAAGTPAVAWAHAVGLSRGTYVVRGREVSAEVTLARVDAASFAGATALAEAVHVSRAGAPCEGTSARFVDAPPDGTSLLALYTCPAEGPLVAIDAAFVADLPFGHRHVAHASSDGPGAATDDVLTRDHHAFEVHADEPLPKGSRDPGATGKPRSSSGDALAHAASFVRMGVEHILTGYDHLLFLLGLVLASRGVRALLAVVTAFTAGHSISLASSALGLWAPSPALIEPLIAVSIAYVGIENLVVREVASRWRLAFLFGLVHGFGFAGALREVHFERESVPLVLASFNIGVELGQLSVLAVVVPVILLLRRQTWFQRRGVVALNGGVAAMGVAWTFVRVLGVGS
jgi:hydrogenase/urease accessory protein HupE